MQRVQLFKQLLKCRKKHFERWVNSENFVKLTESTACSRRFPLFHFFYNYLSMIESSEFSLFVLSGVNSQIIKKVEFKLGSGP